MKVIVDTSIWSLVLRRKEILNVEVENKLSKLIDSEEVILIGPIRQEILSGIKEKKTIRFIKRVFESIPKFYNN